MTKDQILKKWPELSKILVENGIMNRDEINDLTVHIPEYKKNNSGAGIQHHIKGSHRTFFAIVNGNTLTVYAEIDSNDKIIASSTEWNEEIST